METMHHYVVEIQARTENGHPPTVEARKNILAENDSDAQREAERWAATVAGVHNKATYLVIRHDDRKVIDRELRKSL
jgi:hypothetical protein